ncbi:MAG: hypothetical protein JW821_19595 [Deltaproteobacteria bacterium]|nr:hypothetical protein [Deltaproteobacteria bacterium]
MRVDKRDLINALNTSLKELRQGIEMHCCLITSILEGRVDERDLRPVLDLCPGRSQELMMKDAIKEAIDILEESRKAFKSKRLEALRKRLTQVLIDAD